MEIFLKEVKYILDLQIDVRGGFSPVGLSEEDLQGRITISLADAKKHLVFRLYLLRPIKVIDVSPKLLDEVAIRLLHVFFLGFLKVDSVGCRNLQMVILKDEDTCMNHPVKGLFGNFQE